MFVALFFQNHIFSLLTLRLTFWPWRWPLIIKIVQEIVYLIKMTRKRGQHHIKKTYYTSSYFSFLKLVFLLFDFGIDLITLKMTWNPHNNTINGFSGQNPTKKKYYTFPYRYLLKKWYFRLLDLESKLLTLKMTLNNQNNFRNGLPN